MTATYIIKDISNLHIIYFESQRDLRIGSYGNYGGDGANNFIEFQDSHRDKKRFEILIDDDRRLKQILTSWEENGIKFELTYSNPRRK